MDRITKEQRSRNMRSVKSNGSEIEIILGKALWGAGFRYRKNYPKVFGKPDFVMQKYRVAIFCDGEFWHGKDWAKKKNEIKSNRKFWHQKIEANIRRDRLVNRRLRAEGWKVIRIWGKKIKDDPQKCVKLISEAIGT